MAKFEALVLEQLKRKFKKINSIKTEMHVPQGWVRYIRESFNMTLKDLSSKVGVSPAALSMLESRELEGKVTLESLNKVAQALDCTLVYSIVPNKDIEKVIRDQARSKALSIVNRANVHMELEDQGVKSKLKKRVDRLAGELIGKGDIW